MTLMERISLKQVETSERFYRVPKALLTNPFYKEMKPDSKLVYGILKDRLELSIRNNLVDENGHVYLNFSIKSLGELLGFSNKKIVAIKKELKQFGLIEEERQGLNKSNRIYVGEVESEFEVIHRANPLGDKEVNNLHIRKCKSDTSGCEESTLQEVNILHTNDTELSDTDSSDTETNSLDEDDKNNNDPSNASQQAFIAIGKIIEKNPCLRNVVQTLVPDLLLNDPKQTEIVVEALDRGYKYLAAELEKGNSVLTLQQQLQGEVGNERFLTQIGDEQMIYMRNHLVNSSHFGTYFAKGLMDRLKIAITTDNANATLRYQ